MEKESPQSPISTQRHVSLDFIKNSGAFAVRVIRGQKAPHKDEWNPKLNDATKSEMLLRELRNDEVDNFGAHWHGPLVDVDIDSDSPALMAALEILLPPCNHIWGHASRPRTHRAYQLKDSFDPTSIPILDRIKRIEEVKVDLRGGPPSRGKYTLLPGSVHPSGEEYLWVDLHKARYSPTVITIGQLLTAIRLAGAVAVLAPYWIEGLRNDLIMALSGFLHRTAKIAESLGEEAEIFRVDQVLAERFLNVLFDVTGDDKSDRPSRIKTFEATWKKADSDAPVTGASRIVALTGDESLMSKLYTLLTDSPGIALVNEFVDRFAIWVGPGLVIDMKAAAMGERKPFSTRSQFRDSWSHKSVDSAGKKKPVTELLFYLSATMRLNGITFEPGQPLLVDTPSGKKVNQWSGFVIKPYNDPVMEAEVAPFIEYIRDVIASGIEEHYIWVMGWIAHIFQEPANKAGTALVLVGPPGIGKSFLGEHFLVPMIGHHAVVTPSVERAVQGFNALFDNRIFVQCDEAISNRQRQVAARLKSLITDPSIIVEPKGVDPFAKPNHMRLLFTSNETQDAIYLSDGVDDRRYTILRVSDAKKGLVKEYWAPLVQWTRTGENLSRVHRYLSDFKYDHAVISKPPMTKAKIEMQQHSMPGLDRWLAAMVSRQHPLSEEAHKAWYDAPVDDSQEIDRNIWPLRVNLSALSIDFNKFARSDRAVAPLNEQQVKAIFIERNLSSKLKSVRIRTRDFDNRDQKFIIRRIRLYPFPSLDDIAAYLKMKYGSDYDKENEEAEEIDRVGDVKKETEF